MGMSSFEVVRRAVEFQTPDRLPIRFKSLGLSDIHDVGWNQTGTGDHSQRHTLDEWGCTWERSADTANMGQVKGHPLEDWRSLNHYRWPDPDDPSFYTGMEKKFTGSDGKYIMTGIFMLLFERMHALHGFENTLTDLILERERVEMLADRIVEFDLAIIAKLSSRFPGMIHGFHFTDDWGTQQALIVRPSLWRDFFQPRYTRLFQAMHAAGWHVWMHSCGKVNAILENLIEAGVNVVNLQQPRALDIAAVGRQFRGRLCFESLCDIQHTLPFKSPGEIADEARLLLQEWSTPRGGFILSDYGDGRAIGVPLEIKINMLEAFLQADPWKSPVLSSGEN